jgi:hypothetical protein
MLHEPQSFQTSFSRRCVPAIHRAAPVAALALFTGLGACKKDEPAKGDAPASAAAQSTEAAEGEPEASATKSGGGPTTADTLVPATALQRGAILGHVLLPNASVFLEELKTQVAPGSTSMFLSEDMLRNLAAAQLGARSRIATNVDLRSPIGCAMVDSKVTTAPLACVVGYAGGADAIVADLGEQGKQADPAGHLAHYRLSGEDVYIDAIDGHVVLTNHTELFDKAKDYLQSNMIRRAGKVASDVEAVIYVSSVLSRYEKTLTPILNELTEAQSVTAGGNKLSDAMTQYNAQSTQHTVQRLTEMEQLTVGFGLEPSGFVLRYAVFPTAGSRLEAESKASAAGSLDASIVQHLPTSAWLVAGASVDWAALSETESSKELRAVFADAYAAAVGKDPASVKASVERYFDEAAALYGKEMAYAFMFEPDTVGAVMTAAQLAEGKKGRDPWKAWTRQFTPENVLDEESRKKLTWSFSFDAYTVDGIPVDRWVIEPTPAGHKDLQLELGPQLAEVERRLGGLRLVIDRAELDDRVLFVATPMAEEKSMTAAVRAAKGQGNLANDEALDQILARSAGLSMLVAVDVRRLTGWLRDILPASESARIPQDLGNTLSDISVATSYAQSGTQTGELVVSQPFIDQLRALAQ